ncbi:MAG TPA: hypothetical protein VIC26_15595 [Marinagarivorans sp.]
MTTNVGSALSRPVALFCVVLLWAQASYADEAALTASLSIDANEACSSFDMSRREYAKRLLSDRHADNRFAQYQQMVIESIEFARVDVFDTADPDEDKALFRLVNSLNIRTRESALRPQLQFTEGDKLDPTMVSETERNLRGRSYLSDAFIMPVAVCNDRVHLLVVTQDAWTTQPIVSASREGGENKSRFGLVEGNFWGSGSEISVILTKDDQRSSVAYRYSKDYLFGKPLSLGFGFSDNSDGYARSFRFGKPFYTEGTRTAFEASAEQTRGRIKTQQNGTEVAAYDVNSDEKSIYAAFQYGFDSVSVTRVYAGISQRKETYDAFVGQQGLEPDALDNLSYPWLSVEHQSTDFVVMKNVNYIESVEDLRVGGRWRASLGYSPKSGRARAAVVADAAYSQLFILPGALFAFSTDIDSVFYQGAGDNDTYYQAQFTADYRWLLDDRQRVAAIGSYRQARASGIHDALGLGGAEIVRGYPTDYVLGNKAYGGSLEYRYHSNLHLLNILRVGWVGYVDVGVLHNNDFAIDNEGYDRDILGNVGVGLRITSSKTHVGNIVHIDLAVPMGYKKNAGRYQLLLRAEQRF